MIVCKYCKKNKLDLYLECQHCGELVHPNCLKKCSVPGGLLGDVFYLFTCVDCSPSREEKLERDRMKWVDVLLLTLYNLSKTSSALSYRGYFHSDKHIKKFITTHWNTISPYLKSKRKSWSQMIAKNLNSSEYFTCGDGILEFQGSMLNGWYKLAHSDMLPNHAMLKRKGKKRKRHFEQEQPHSSHSTEDSMWYDNSCSTSFHIFCNESSSAQENMYSRSYVKPSASLSEYLFAGEDTSDDVDIEVTDSESAVDIRCNESSSSLFSLKTEPTNTENIEILVTDIKVEDEAWSETETVVDPDDKSNSEVCSTSSTVVSESLFVKNEDSNYKPWLKQAYRPTNCEAIKENEEHYVLSDLSKKIFEGTNVSIAEIRLHRKLRVRRLKRERNLPVFDLDVCSKTDWSSYLLFRRPKEYRVLDRFQRQTVVTDAEDQITSFRTRLMGHTEQYTCFTSPFTQRVLKPFIRRDYESCPLWLNLMRELETKVNSKDPSWVSPPRAPVDYSYVRPQHIPAINSLAQQYFWPGINLSECLQYPDFSCVVLYKKLVIGFAFLVPDVSYNEAYISFIFTRPDWRRSGIATFMLYHIIQTCMGRDITLHVSATNPALLLYQKFGFKVEEFVQDFYEKYLPADSNDCRHALFLRLSR